MNFYYGINRNKILLIDYLKDNDPITRLQKSDMKSELNKL